MKNSAFDLVVSISRYGHADPFVVLCSRCQTPKRDTPATGNIWWLVFQDNSAATFSLCKGCSDALNGQTSVSPKDFCDEEFMRAIST